MSLCRFVILTALAGLLAGCAGDDLPSARGVTIEDGYDPSQDSITGKPRHDNGEVSGSLFGDSLSFGSLGGEKGVQLPVNRYIWRSALETLSFLPLTSTDPYGGVIVTDWGTAPGSANERFKVTAFITSAEFKPQSLRISVNRQVMDRAGNWVGAAVAPETARKLEDAILTRARQLRVANRDGRNL